MIKTDVVIVGGGIVGATLAALMQNSVLKDKLKVILLDGFVPPEHLNTQNFDPRVVALSSASATILEQAGVWENIVSTRACPYKHMRVWDADGTGHIEFSADDVHAHHLGHIVENKVIQHALNEKLNRAMGLHQMRGEQLVKLEAAPNGTANSTSKGYVLTLSSGEQIRAEMVVGADGSRSKVRELLNFSIKSWEYGQTAIVTTVETELAHQFCAWQRFASIGPVAFLPLTKTGDDANTCSIVWSVDTEKADQFMALNDAEFKQALGAALEFRLGNIIEVDKRLAIPLKQCFASTYVKPGCALVGDAAHAIHPLAGQGVNMGLYDVKALMDELIRAYERNVPLSEMATLRRYERKRQPHNLLAMTAMECFKRGFGTDNVLVRYLRNTGMSFVNQQAPLKQFLTKLAAGA